MRFPPFNPRLAVAIGVSAVSLSAVLVKLAGAAPAAIIANYRVLFAALAIIPFLMLSKRTEIKRLKWTSWLLLLVAAILLASHLTTWYTSLQHTSVASSVSLLALQPIAAFLLSAIIKKERFSAGASIGILIAIFGMLIILIGDLRMRGGFFFGDGFALGSMLLLAVYHVIGQKIRIYLSLLSYTFLVYAVASIALLLFNLGDGNAFTGYTAHQWWYFAALALIPTFLGYALFNWALKWLQSASVSIGMMLEPAGAATLAYFILKEQITVAQLLGGAVILFGLFLFIMSTARKPKVTISKK